MPFNPQVGNRFISEFHKDIVKSVAALPAASAALAGFRRFRTSDNLEYFCDGTQWLSVNKHALPIGTRGTMPFAQAATIFNVDLPRLGANGIYVTDLECAFRPISAAQSGTNFYTLSFTVSSTSVVNTIVLTGTGQTDTTLFTTAGNRYSMKPVFTPVALDSTYFWGEVTMTPSGNPGTFIFFGTVGYRLIGA
jgi:hypothetical protein